MKGKQLIAFQSKLFRPCKKFLQIFKFRFKKPIFIKSLRFRGHNSKPRKTHPKKLSFCRLISFFRPPQELEEMDEVRKLRSVTEAGQDQVLFPSPLTPAYVRHSGTGKREVAGHEIVQDACRSFENYLAEMIVEEGKVRDLNDVEELLYCWKNLKCPVFIDLVSRFYGELCKDLFSGEEENIDSPK